MQPFFEMAVSEQAGLPPGGMGLNGMAGTVTLTCITSATEASGIL